MNEREKEIASVAASVAAGCLRCLEYHKQQALDVGVSQDELLKIAHIAMIIRNKADKYSMNDLDTILLENHNSAIRSTTEPTDSLCCEEK
ncbi:MAG: carboxymuconolactone decarboxylase family protein [Candidatus Hodarchaeales archaeon]